MASPLALRLNAFSSLGFRPGFLHLGKPSYFRDPIQKSFVKFSFLKRNRAIEDTSNDPVAVSVNIGEDAAVFDWKEQSLQSWGLFSVLLSSVLGFLYFVCFFMIAICFIGPRSGFNLQQDTAMNMYRS